MQSSTVVAVASIGSVAVIRIVVVVVRVVEVVVVVVIAIGISCEAGDSALNCSLRSVGEGAKEEPVLALSLSALGLRTTHAQAHHGQEDCQLDHVAQHLRRETRGLSGLRSE